MDKPLFSEHWYRVKTLRPALRPHTRLHRQEYRGEVWYVLQDETSGRYHRFNGAAYQVIGLMNGQRTVHRIWEEVNSQLGDDAPVQDDIIHLLGQLHQAGALQTDIAPDLQEMVGRGEAYEDQQWRARFRNPLAIRISLCDPDRFLHRALPLVRLVFSKTFMLLWCLLVMAGALLAFSQWEALLDTVRHEALEPVNLALLWAIYPLVKLLHELGHGFAAKLEGGEVHDMGVMLLVFVPVPYVDASAATAFRDKRMRMLVGAAGVMVEMLLAVLALFVWLAVEPGIVRSICLNVMLIGGVSTLLFNGNPLLRFDGYYVLADALGIPNLAQRANNYLAYLAQRWLLGMQDARSPVTAAGEAPWFVFYAIASFCYRLSIMLLICFFLIDTLFVVGVLLAGWAVYSQIVLPLLKQIRFLLVGPELRRQRGRALFASGLCAAALAVVVLALPMTSLTRFEGVIWPPEDSRLVTETEGFVLEFLEQPGNRVTRGQPLLRLANTQHVGEMAVKRARMKELSARFRQARVHDRVKTRLVQEEISSLQGEIDNLQEKIEALLITSPATGIFVLPDAQDLPGQYVRQGHLLGYVLNDDPAVARVVVTQEDQDRIAQRLDDLSLRLASDLDTVLPGQLLREVPQASNRLPSPVLSVDGGGPFALDPAGLTELSTRERVFEFEVELPLTLQQARIGTRVYVRFDHGHETLWQQFGRRFRQLVLRRLNA